MPRCKTKKGKTMKRFSDILRETRKAKRLQEDQLYNTNSEDKDYPFTYAVLALDKDSSMSTRKQQLLEFAATLLHVKESDVFLFATWIPR
jgi:hypothetical protein